jgi:hypothetical protein
MAPRSGREKRVPRLSEGEIYRKELLSAIDALAELRFTGNRVLALVHVLNTVEREIESSPLWKATGEKVLRAARLVRDAERYPNVEAFAAAQRVKVTPDAMKLRLRRARADLKRIKGWRLYPELPEPKRRGRPRRGKG